jgi:L-histidine N-alpha-methyltransferase
MRLRALKACSVEIDDLGMTVEFEAGEELRTEISAKFTRERLQTDYCAAGLAMEQWYTDEDELFALSLAGPEHA